MPPLSCLGLPSTARPEEWTGLGTVKGNSIHLLSICTCSVSCPPWSQELRGPEEGPPMPEHGSTPDLALEGRKNLHIL